MPKPVAWCYQKLIKPMFDPSSTRPILWGSILTGSGDEVIEDGFVEFVVETVSTTSNEGRHFV